MRCLTRAWEKGASRKAAVRIAASVLTKAALDRGSKDNVTVVIVDLKAPKPTSSDGEVGCSMVGWCVGCEGAWGEVAFGACRLLAAGGMYFIWSLWSLVAHGAFS